MRLKRAALFCSFSALVEADDAPFFLPFLPIPALLSSSGLMNYSLVVAGFLVITYDQLKRLLIGNGGGIYGGINTFFKGNGSPLTLWGWVNQ
eukprot:scaffold30769_cov160-Skeletonema_menzelii.AAC.2